MNPPNTPLPQPPNPPPAGEESVVRVEVIISGILRAGVWASLTLIVLGTLIGFARHADYRWAHFDAAFLAQLRASLPHRPGAVWWGFWHGQGRAMVLVGLIVLIATPVVRVAASILAYAFQRDWVFVVITTAVLGLLTLSFVLGAAE